MLSPSRIKVELFSSDDDEEESPSSVKDVKDEDEKVELLEFERNVMLDTFSDDVLFVLARGLGLERLMLHHFHLYSDPKLLVLVINTSQHDEAYFLAKLRDSGSKCSPKVITSEVSVKDRESLYMEGGVQFVTSRILMVDLLQGRVPVKNVAGIIVSRAHQLLSSYQESFVLRLYREKKRDGFVKAFSDNPGALTGIGVLQRLVNLLYIRRVRLLPRFDVDVKRVLDLNAPKLSEILLDMPLPMRKIQSALVDIIRTCVRELKQSSTNVDAATDEESTQRSAGLTTTQLEIQLKGRQFSTTERQQRLMSDLKQLRELLCQAEDIDPATLYQSLVSIRADKDQVKTNSGWLFTPTFAKVFVEAEKLCNVKVDNDFTIFEPPKWRALKSVLKEIQELQKKRRENGQKTSPVLLLTASSEVSRQVCDLIKWGPDLLKWIQRKKIIGETSSKSRKAMEPPSEPLWDPAGVVLFASSLEGETRADIVNDIKAVQKIAARRARKRRKQAEIEIKKKSGDNQTRLVQFGIVHYKKQKKEHDVEAGPSSASNEQAEEVFEGDEERLSSEKMEDTDQLLVIFPQGERYNLLRQLDSLAPAFVILYHSDLVSLRLLEMYRACKPECDLHIYALMYRESNEEERYLCALRREQLAFEHLVREQGTLMTAREYDTAREPPPRLKLSKSTRNAGGRVEEAADENPKVIIDMREFNSKLPTVLYKRGTDLVPATLEVGDYILSPNIAVERKALDDLTQSLHSGRVFKQIEQMLRYYKKAILLVEGDVKNDFKKINGGPFQGELSRRCRETRFLFAVLVRQYPAVNVVWTLDPVNSAEMFEEFKLNEANPDPSRALAIKSDGDECIDREENAAAKTEEGSSKGNGSSKKQCNAVLQRQLNRLPGLASGDVTRMMKSEHASCLLDVINASDEDLTNVFNNPILASNLRSFFDRDFKADAVNIS